jgi:uncharacterized protein (DUF1697 family)
MRYLALLRGINVGGKNLFLMTDLRNRLEGAGLEHVATYIQSGNVLFESRLRNIAKLSHTIEQALSQGRINPAAAFVVSEHQLEGVVKDAPSAFGLDPKKYRYYAAFLKTPLIARELLPSIELREGVDEVFESSGVLYFKKLIARATESKFPKLTSSHAYKDMTIRNWNTVLKLLELIANEPRQDRT